MATSIQSLRELQHSLNTAIDSYAATAEQKGADSSAIEQAGKDVCRSANRIVDAVTDPSAAALQLGFQPIVNLISRIAVDLDLFNLINEKTTLEELVKQTKADRTFLLRTLRLMVSTRIFSEPEPNTYSSTTLSETLRYPPLRDWIKICFDSLNPIWLQIPAYLAKNGYNDITDLSNNPTLTMYGSNFFDQLGADPKREADFASAMKLQDLAPKTAVPQFPYSEGIESFESEIKKGGSDVFFVDVGGGQGQYLSRLIKENPELPGRKILQDLPSVVVGVDRNVAAFEPMGHDFFTPQPIKGAKYYHLRGIMHDWPDQSCVEILTQLRDVFKPGHSRLLIHSNVLPEVGCGVREAMEDINLWTCCGKERAPSQWRELLRKARFEILRIVKAETGLYGIIEARPVDEDADSGTTKL